MEGNVLLAKDRLSGLSRGPGLGLGQGKAAEYSQMLTALGHSPDILRKQKDQEKRQWSPEPM